MQKNNGEYYTLLNENVENPNNILPKDEFELEHLRQLDSKKHNTDLSKIDEMVNLGITDPGSTYAQAIETRKQALKDDDVQTYLESTQPPWYTTEEAKDMSTLVGQRPYKMFDAEFREMMQSTPLYKFSQRGFFENIDESKAIATIFNYMPDSVQGVLSQFSEIPIRGAIGFIGMLNKFSTMTGGYDPVPYDAPKYNRVYDPESETLINVPINYYGRDKYPGNSKKIAEETFETIQNNLQKQSDIFEKERVEDFSEVQLRSAEYGVSGLAAEAAMVLSYRGKGKYFAPFINYGRYYDEALRESGGNHKIAASYTALWGTIGTAIDLFISGIGDRLLSRVGAKTMNQQFWKQVSGGLGQSQASGLAEYASEFGESVFLQKTTGNREVDYNRAHKEAMMAYIVGSSVGTGLTVSSIKNRQKVAVQLDKLGATEQEKVDFLDLAMAGDRAGAEQVFSQVRNRAFEKISTAANDIVNPKTSVEMPSKFNPWTLDQIHSIRDLMDDVQLDQWIIDTFPPSLRALATEAFRTPNDKARINLNRAKVKFYSRKDSQDFGAFNDLVDSKGIESVIGMTYEVFDSYGLKTTDRVVTKINDTLYELQRNGKIDKISEEEVASADNVFVTAAAADLAEKYDSVQLLDQLGQKDLAKSIGSAIEDELDFDDEDINDIDSPIDVSSEGLKRVYASMSLSELSDDASSIMAQNGLVPTELIDEVSDRYANDPQGAEMWMVTTKERSEVKKKQLKNPPKPLLVLPKVNRAYDNTRVKRLLNQGYAKYENALKTLEFVLLPQDPNNKVYVNAAKRYAEKSGNKWEDELNQAFIFKRRQRVDQVRKALSDAVYLGNVSDTYAILDELGMKRNGKFSQMVISAASDLKLADKLAGVLNGVERKGLEQRMNKEEIKSLVIDEGSASYIIDPATGFPLYVKVPKSSAATSRPHQNHVVSKWLTSAKNKIQPVESIKRFVSIGAGKKKDKSGKLSENHKLMRERLDANISLVDPDNYSMQENIDAYADIINSPADAAEAANVLNTISDQSIRESVIKSVYASLKPGGYAYFKIFPGRKGKGKDSTVTLEQAYTDNQLGNGDAELNESMYQKNLQQGIEPDSLRFFYATRDGEQLNQEPAFYVGEIEAVFDNQISTISDEIIIIQKPDTGAQQVGTSPTVITRTELNQQIENATQALAEFAPDVEILVYDTTEEYNEASGRPGSRAYADIFREDGRRVIYVNAEYAVETSVPHEVMHVIFNGTQGFGAEAEAKARQLLDDLRGNVREEDALFIEEFSLNYDENIRNSEMLAELFGIMATNYDALPKKPKSKIDKFIDFVATKLGFEKYVQTKQSKYDLLMTLAGKVSQGNTISGKEINDFLEVDLAETMDPDVDINDISIDVVNANANLRYLNWLDTLSLDSFNLTESQKEQVMLYVAQQQGYDPAVMEQDLVDVKSLPEDVQKMLPIWSQMAKDIANDISKISEELDIPFTAIDGFYFPLRHMTNNDLANTTQEALDISLRGLSRRTGKYEGVIKDPVQQLELYLKDAARILAIGEAKIAMIDKFKENTNLSERIAIVLEKYGQQESLTEYEQNLLNMYTDMQKIDEESIKMGIPRSAYSSPTFFNRIRRYQRQGGGQDLSKAPEGIFDLLPDGIKQKLKGISDSWANVIDPHFVVQKMDNIDEITDSGNIYGENAALWQRVLQAEALSRFNTGRMKYAQVKLLTPFDTTEKLDAINDKLYRFIIANRELSLITMTARSLEDFVNNVPSNETLTAEEAKVIYWYATQFKKMKTQLALGSTIRSDVSKIKREERAEFLRIESDLEQGLPVSDDDLKKYNSYSVNMPEGSRGNITGKIMRWMTEKNAINSKDFFGYFDGLLSISNKGGFFYDLTQEIEAWASYLDSKGQTQNAKWWRTKVDSNIIGNMFKFEDQLLSLAAKNIKKVNASVIGDRFDEQTHNKLETMTIGEMKASAFNATQILQQARINAFLVGNIGWSLTTQPSSIAFTIKQTDFGTVAKAILGLIQGNRLLSRSDVSRIKSKLEGVDRLEASSEFFDINVKQTKRGKLRNVLSSFGGLVEGALTDVSFDAGYMYAKNDLGLTDDQARIHGDFVAATTQSMYSRASRNTALNSELLRFMNPLQTYVFTAMSNVLDSVGVVGRNRSAQRRVAEFLRWLLAQRLMVVLWSMYFGDDFSKALFNPVWSRATVGGNIPIFGKKVDIALSKVIPWQDDKSWQSPGAAETFIKKTETVLKGVANNDENWEREAIKYTARYITPFMGIAGTAPFINMVNLIDAAEDNYRFEGISGRKYAEFENPNIATWASGFMFGVKAVDKPEGLRK